ncbi:hypothetical protein WJX73_001421 [Symbiochloris irregularis]|uniref:Ubiquitin-like protease family profile domain-containing protein n=1 Tax=Symbiochloris irregularis TaxID=706552 RepID=A0AAW1Q3W2_9CHLO
MSKSGAPEPARKAREALQKVEAAIADRLSNGDRGSNGDKRWLNKAKSNQEEYNHRLDQKASAIASQRTAPDLGLPPEPWQEAQEPEQRQQEATARKRKQGSNHYTRRLGTSQAAWTSGKPTPQYQKGTLSESILKSSSTSGASAGAQCAGCHKTFAAGHYQVVDGLSVCQGCLEEQKTAIGNGNSREGGRQGGQGGIQFYGRIPRLAAERQNGAATAPQGRASEGPYQTRQKGPAKQTVLSDSGGAVRQSQRPGSAKRQKTTPVKAEPQTIELFSDEDEPPSGGNQQAGANAEPRRTSQRVTRSATLGPRDTASRFEGLRAVYPLTGGKGSVEVLPNDLQRLDDAEFLNDTIIDFYLKHIYERLPPDMQAKVHIFNSFFYTKIAAKSPRGGANGGSGSSEGSAGKAQRNFESVRKWTQTVDIFSKEYVVVPIHDHLHWSLLIVCHPGAMNDDSDRVPCMLHLDSLSGCHTMGQITRAARDYLQQEWDRKLGESTDSVAKQWQAANPGASFKFSDKTVQAHKVMPLPQQDNYCDCGLFLLTYAEFFLSHAPPTISIKSLSALRDRPDSPLFLSRDWFPPSNASALRGHLRYIILGMFREQAPSQTGPVDHALAQATADISQYQHDQGSTVSYQDPVDYQPTARKRHAQLLEAERKKGVEKEEKKQREADARREREAKVSSQGGSKDSPEQMRKKIAQAAENRRSKEELRLEQMSNAAAAREARGSGDTEAQGDDEDIEITLDHDSADASPEPEAVEKSVPGLRERRRKSNHIIFSDDDDEAHTEPPAQEPQERSPVKPRRSRRQSTGNSAGGQSPVHDLTSSASPHKQQTSSPLQLPAALPTSQNIPARQRPPSTPLRSVLSRLSGFGQVSYGQGCALLGMSDSQQQQDRIHPAQQRKTVKLVEHSLSKGKAEQPSHISQAGHQSPPAAAAQPTQEWAPHHAEQQAEGQGHLQGQEPLVASPQNPPHQGLSPQGPHAYHREPDESVSVPGSARAAAPHPAFEQEIAQALETQATLNSSGKLPKLKTYANTLNWMATDVLQCREETAAMDRHSLNPVPRLPLDLTLSE